MKLRSSSVGTILSNKFLAVLFVAESSKRFCPFVLFHGGNNWLDWGTQGTGNREEQHAQDIVILCLSLETDLPVGKLSQKPKIPLDRMQETAEKKTHSLIQMLLPLTIYRFMRNLTPGTSISTPCPSADQHTGFHRPHTLLSLEVTG